MESKMDYETSITHFWSLKALIVSFLLQLLSRFLLILIVVITPPLANAALNTADSIFSLATCLNAVTIFIARRSCRGYSGLSSPLLSNRSFTQ